MSACFEARSHDGGQGSVWTYDSRYRLVEEKRDVASPPTEWANPGQSAVADWTQYTLDGAGNWGTTNVNGSVSTNSTNSVNEYGQFGGDAQAYDENGNRTSDGQRTYRYDALNRLIAVADKVTGQDILRFKYDAFGRRTQKKRADGTGVRFVYFDQDLVEERELVGGQLIRQYVIGSRLNELLQVLLDEGTGLNAFWPLTDALGSIVGLCDDAGTVVQETRFDAYGVPTEVMSALASGANPTLFTGSYYDVETGLYCYRNRYYDPVQGRFLNRDPLGIWGDSTNVGNGYTYVGNNPVNYYDPLGLGFWDYFQGALDVVGMIPAVGNAADLLNAGISTVRGNYGDAALSLGAAVPGAGLGRWRGQDPRQGRGRREDGRQCRRRGAGRRQSRRCEQGCGQHRWRVEGDGQGL